MALAGARAARSAASTRAARIAARTRPRSCGGGTSPPAPRTSPTPPPTTPTQRAAPSSGAGRKIFGSKSKNIYLRYVYFQHHGRPVPAAGGADSLGPPARPHGGRGAVRRQRPGADQHGAAAEAERDDAVSVNLDLDTTTTTTTCQIRCSSVKFNDMPPGITQLKTSSSSRITLSSFHVHMVHWSQ